LPIAHRAGLPSGIVTMAFRDYKKRRSRMAPRFLRLILRAHLLPMLSRLLGGLKVAGVNVLVFGILWLAIETVLWWREGSQAPDQWRFEIDPVMGHARNPKVLAYSTNAARSISPSRHFTLEEYAATSDDEPTRILTLGGSTTDPLGERFSGADGTWPAHLGRALQKRGRSVAIANGGVGSFASSQELLKLISVLAFFEIDLAIALNGINEIYFEQNRLLAEGDDELMVSHTFLNNVRRGRESVIRYDGKTFVPCNWVVCIESRLFPQLAVAVEELARPWRRRDEPVPTISIYLDETMRGRLDRAAAIWRRNVRTAEAVAATNGAAYVVVLQPTMGIGVDRAEALAAAAAGDERLAEFVAELLEDAYLERINHLYDRLQAHCEALDFCIDLSRPAALPPLAAELYADPRHPNSDGNRIIAELLAERLHTLRSRERQRPVDVTADDSSAIVH
jgi:hypothetical protein